MFFLNFCLILKRGEFLSIIIVLVEENTINIRFFLFCLNIRIKINLIFNNFFSFSYFF